MAYFKITQNKKGELQAKIQVSGKDLSTGKSKVFTKRVYNTDELTEAKFRKQVEKTAIAFEEEVSRAYQDGKTQLRSKVLTFSELMQEWKANIKAGLSVNYYERAEKVEKIFGEFLEQNGLADKPISAITVRDVQRFLSSFTLSGYKSAPKARLKKPLPKQMNFRLMARENVIDRCASYNLIKKGANIAKETAETLCDRCGLDYDEYFETIVIEKPYAAETIKGYRRILRALFNEAVRYEWINKNPVCATKVGAEKGNTSLRPVAEKEVFTVNEARAFLRKLDEDIPDDEMHKKVILKFILLTGVRNGEMCGLKWSDIDFDKKVVHIRRNRLYSKQFGYYEKTPKTKTSVRDIPLTDVLIDDLKKYMGWFRLADEEFDSRLDETYLAVNVYRQPLYPQSIGQWLTFYERKWDMKHVTCHGLRHTYCSLLLAQNVPIQTVSKYMGHSDSTVTLKVYSHFIPDTQGIAVNALNRLTE